MKKSRLMLHLFVVASMMFFIGLLTASSASAAGECKGDLARFCQGAQGPKQELECLKMNREQLSPQCKMHIVTVLKAVKNVHEDCAPEIYAFCPGVQPGGGRVLKCLKAHKSELSPTCKAGIADMMMSR